MRIILGVALGLAIFCGLVGGWLVFVIPPINQEPIAWIAITSFISFVSGSGITLIVVMLSQGSLSLYSHINDVREHKQEREKSYQDGFRVLTDMFRAANQGQQFLNRQEALPGGPQIIFDDELE